jgi:hypothetical protein
MVVFAGNGGGRKDVAPLGDIYELNLVGLYKLNPVYP